MIIQIKGAPQCGAPLICSVSIFCMVLNMNYAFICKVM